MIEDWGCGRRQDLIVNCESDWPLLQCSPNCPRSALRPCAARASETFISMICQIIRIELMISCERKSVSFQFISLSLYPTLPVLPLLLLLSLLLLPPRLIHFGKWYWLSLLSSTCNFDCWVKSRPVTTWDNLLMSSFSRFSKASAASCKFECGFSLGLSDDSISFMPKSISTGNGLSSVQCASDLLNQ